MLGRNGTQGWGKYLKAPIEGYFGRQTPTRSLRIEAVSQLVGRHRRALNWKRGSMLRSYQHASSISGVARHNGRPLLLS